ncbi:MAG: hypothetical protein HY965_03640 [Ignavibacteriales bacterium]|nr:hypothetical protein [Ignavibacteriales bacterium]
MSLIVAWVGHDSRKPASLYFAADSRISWGNVSKFDYCKKVFGCKNSPDIFAYCGDVLFPSIILNQLIDLADNGLLFSPNASVETKFHRFFSQFAISFRRYPTARLGATTLELLYGSRRLDGSFFCRKMKWEMRTNKWVGEDIEIKNYSDKAFICGSGSRLFKDRFDVYSAGPTKRTSQAVFHCFCDVLDQSINQTFGGAPQLVGLYNKFNTQFFGIIHKGSIFFDGLKLDKLINFDKLNWRNELFEICDGFTRKKLENAQSQPNPILGV